MLLLALTLSFQAVTPQTEALVQPFSVADFFESDELVPAPEGVSFWFDRGDGQTVALVPAPPLIDLFQPDEAVALDEDFGLWPDPFAFDTNRFGLAIGEVELDGPAWAAWDWTFTLACRAPLNLDPQAIVLTPSYPELRQDTSLSLAYLNVAGDVRQTQLRIAELPSPEEERYWLSVRPAGNGEIPPSARVIGAPLLDENGGVVGVVGRRMGNLLQAQPIGEFSESVPYWRAIWHHELGTDMWSFDLSEDATRLVLVGEAIELIQWDGMQLLARIEMQDLADQLGIDTLPPDVVSAALTPGGETLYVQWSEHLHAVPLGSLENDEFELVLGPQLMSPGMQDRSYYPVEVEALSDGTVLLWETYDRPVRIGAQGGARLPGDGEAQVAYLPDWGHLLDGYQTRIHRYEFPSGNVLPDVLLNEPVDIEFASLSPSGRRLGLSDAFEGWIDVVSLNDGAEPVSPDVTIAPYHEVLQGLTFAGEDRLITYGGEWYETEDSLRSVDGALSLVDAWTGEQLARSGEFLGHIVQVRELPSGRLLALSDLGELACFDPDQLRGSN